MQYLIIVAAHFVLMAVFVLHSEEGKRSMVLYFCIGFRNICCLCFFKLLYIVQETLLLFNIKNLILNNISEMIPKYQRSSLCNNIIKY